MTEHPAKDARGRRRAGLGRKLGISAASFALLFVFAEVGFRLAGYAKGPARYYDPEIGTLYYPSQTRWMMGQESPEAPLRKIARARVNSRGFRGPWRDAPRENGVRRIVCLGDSFTFGWGAADDEAYPYVLERTLAEERGEGQVEVVNLGIPGFNTWNELQVYRRFARPLQPDVVVLGFYMNDVRPDPGGPLLTDSLFMRLVGKTALAEAFHRHVRGRFRAFESTRTPELTRRLAHYDKHLFEIQYHPDGELGRPFWEECEADFRALVSEVRADGAEILCVYFPSRIQVTRVKTAQREGPEEHAAALLEWREPQAWLAARCAALDVPFLDLLEPFVAQESDPFGKIDRGHPRAIGYAVSAASVMAALVEFGLL